MLHPSVRKALPLLSVLLLSAVLPVAVAGQTGQVTGTVASQETGEPLGAVQVYLEGTGRATITRADGSFTLGDIPAGSYTLVAQLIGHQTVRQTDVSVASGATVNLRLLMSMNVLALQGVVATGLIDPIEGVRSPITVATVTREMMPVQPLGGAQLAIQGRVAGATVIRTTGQPGTEGSVILRTPTSIRGSNAPLMVVDGVILGSTTADIEAMDIESIEIIKGAAASSLYGSRAAAGVIAITTSRGRGLAAGQTRFSARTEMGHSFVPLDFKLPDHHAFAVDPSTGEYVDRQGNVTNRAGRFEPAVAFMDKQYPPGTQLYNNIREIWRPGRYNTQNFQIAQNHESTNFAASVNRYRELGSLEGNDGYIRNAFRVNLDHRFRNTMSVGISAYASRAQRDEIIGGIGLLGNQFYDMLTLPRDVDIRAKDPNCDTWLLELTKCYYQSPDPTTGVENPVWRQLSRDDDRQHDRQLASAEYRWNPNHWLSLQADASYDRLAATREQFTNRGIPTNVAGTTEAGGSIRFDNSYTDTFNGSVQASLRRDFGLMNTRTTLRGIMENDRTKTNWTSGSNFHVQGLRTIQAAADKNGNGSLEEVASTGYLWDTALEYDGKYIGTVLVRRDGSSLFGPENRWHTYYRGAVAYRLSEEPWFNLPRVDEFKLKFSQGTAGGRPTFANRYETWNVGAGGITRTQLGNRALAPEHTIEREFGLDMILNGRISVEVTHARQTTTDQIVNLQVPAVTGYTRQWVNAGEMKGHTTELVVESRVMTRRDFSWTTNIVADRSRSEITRWEGPCHVQFLSRLCPGTNLQDIYGVYLYERASELPANLQPYASQFQTNDDGFLVWVGEGNSYRDGIAKDLWGTQTTLGGRTLRWGHPFPQLDDSGLPEFVKIGSGEPDFNLGWMNTIRKGNFTFHTQMHASVGHELFNATLFFNGIAALDPRMDQTGKPDELKKPMSYHRGNPVIRDGLNVGTWDYTSSHVEDASYLKLRTAAVTYRLNDNVLNTLGFGRMGLDNVTVGVTGRNLFTITNYSGFDPEGGLFTENRITPQDWYSYPKMRNVTATIEIGF